MPWKAMIAKERYLWGRGVSSPSEVCETYHLENTDLRT